MTLLMIGVQPLLAPLVRRLVARDGLRLIECRDGRDARDACRTVRADCVLIDFSQTSPEVLATARLVRHAQPAARVLILGDGHDAWLREAAHRLGAQAFVANDDLLSLPALLEA